MDPTFDPYSCFTRIDRACTTFVSSPDILKFLIESQQAGQISEFDINFVIKFFDSTFKGVLNYQDFMQIILPCFNPELRTKATQQ